MSDFFNDICAFRPAGVDVNRSPRIAVGGRLSFEGIGTSYRCEKPDEWTVLARDSKEG
jgi:hypothetical protein